MTYGTNALALREALPRLYTATVVWIRVMHSSAPRDLVAVRNDLKLRGIDPHSHVRTFADPSLYACFYGSFEYVRVILGLRDFSSNELPKILSPF